MENCPQARYSDIVISAYKEEVLLYDLKSHKCHTLNETAASIWQQCDGKSEVSAIASNLFADVPKEAREELVILALSELSQAGLILNAQGLGVKTRSDRREMIEKVGAASMIALPIVASIVAPPASQAQSCGGPVCGGNCCAAGNTCGNNNNCCPPQNCGSIPVNCPCSLNCSGCNGSVCNTITGFCQ